MSATSIAVSIIDRGEAFDAETAARKIAPFGREQALFKLVGIGAIGEQRRKAFLRHLEETLIAPERIIGVEGDGGDYLPIGYWAHRVFRSNMADCNKLQQNSLL